MEILHIIPQITLGLHGERVDLWHPEYPQTHFESKIFGLFFHFVHFLWHFDHFLKFDNVSWTCHMSQKL